jgi:hypothetical protein
MNDTFAPPNDHEIRKAIARPRKVVAHRTKDVRDGTRVVAEQSAQGLDPDAAPSEQAVGAAPSGGYRLQDDRKGPSGRDGLQFRVDRGREARAKRAVLEAARHPVETAGQLGAFEQFVPEQQAEQGEPQRIFGVEDDVTIAPQHARDVCFRIVPAGVVHRDGPPGT